MQPLEAMLFILDEINRDETLLPGVTLGVTALDSCDDPFHAAEKSLHLVQGGTSNSPNIRESHCFQEELFNEFKDHLRNLRSTLKT